MRKILQTSGLLAAASVLLASAAEAHTGAGATHGLAAGFLHPVMGLDHVVVMIAVGVLAARIGGRGLWILPAAFVSCMAAGAAASLAGFAVPFVETAILVSVIAMGALAVLRFAPSLSMATMLAACFAVFHGAAHGAEMPADVSGLSFGLGFVLATIGLHGMGIAAASLIAARSQIAVKQ